jgi:RNA polymerase-interacting CarD/CdnL/TRCF family regulator
VPTATATTLSETLTEKQAKEIIKNWPDVRQDLYIKDSKLRKTTYENTLKTGDVVALAPLLEGAFQRKARDGHLNSLDAQFVAKAVPLVYGALAQSLGIEYGDVPEYIVEHRSY